MKKVLSLNLQQDWGKSTASNSNRRLSATVGLNETEQTPLFQGMGTHYSFLYIGTPPQRLDIIQVVRWYVIHRILYGRVSVIVGIEVVAL